MRLTKNKKIILAVCILAAIILAFIGGTVFAKYQSNLTGTGVADIAKWDFSVNGNGTTVQTISLAESYDESTLVNGKIAPGTSGSFDIIIDAGGSDVGVDYSVSFLNETNKPTNLKFKYGNVESNTLQGLTSALTGTIDADAQTKEELLTVEWFWDYETGTGNQIAANDVIDTNEGIADLNYTFDVAVTGTQVTPQQ